MDISKVINVFSIKYWPLKNKRSFWENEFYSKAKTDLAKTIKK